MIQFQKQPMMRKVVYSLIPIYLFALYLYGKNLLLLSLIVFPAGIAAEFALERFNKKKVSEAVLVTSLLFVLSLPPRTPWWIALIGIVFGVIFGKEVFGGFGRNPFNPAIAGRLFIYLSFPSFMTYGWKVPGNFGFAPDAAASATPLGILRDGGQIDLLQSLLGIRTGSMGESMIPLILAAALYLIITKTASWEIMVSTLASFLVVTAALALAGVTGAYQPAPSLLSGSFLFVTVFMATDPVSAPKKARSRWLYGGIIGSVTVLIRTFSLFPEGTSFGVLLGNTFAPLLDEIFTVKKGKGNG